MSRRTHVPAGLGGNIGVGFFDQHRDNPAELEVVLSLMENEVKLLGACMEDDGLAGSSKVGLQGELRRPPPQRGRWQGPMHP